MSTNGRSTTITPESTEYKKSVVASNFDRLGWFLGEEGPGPESNDTVGALFDLGDALQDLMDDSGYVAELEAMTPEEMGADHSQQVLGLFFTTTLQCFLARNGSYADVARALLTPAQAH